MPGRAALLAFLAAWAVACAVGAPASAAGLEAGVGRADITPPTGYYMMGWVRSDAVARGQHTRLYAKAIVLSENGHKVALVTEDLNGIPGGMLEAAADELKPFGFSEQNVLDSASHTHAAPSQFYNFPSYNTVFMTNSTPTQQNVSGSLDPQLYAFEVRQLALAIRRANDNLGPARAAWGYTQLLGVTQNRSLEAHLANFGINEPYGTGSVNQDPGGYPDTIDPSVDVLRVDKLLPVTVPATSRRTCGRRARRGHGLRARRRARLCRARRRVAAKRAISARHRRRRRRRTTTPTHPQTMMRYFPVGLWTNFSDHGTVNKASFTYYNADHHGSAMRVSEAEMRAAGGTPASQDVVAAYGNSDEGDVTAGIMHTGPADAEWVGRQEADATLAAWRDAGAHLSDSLPIDERWTRMCFCGQDTTGGQVDNTAVFGVPQLTGSEEGRGPLYDNTHMAFEGDHLAFDTGPQGDKIQDARSPPLDVPQAVPMMALQIGDRMMVSIPGEMTVTMGQRVRKAVVDATAGAGISRVVIAGLANEYLSYFTTPEEYEMQHYEGGSTLYGRYSSNLLMTTLADLGHRLVTGQPAPDPYSYDPTHGVSPDAAPFPPGATSATATGQPQDTTRFGHAVFRWSGGARGLDRPLDAPFVTIRRRVGDQWQPVTDDLGLQILWGVDDQGVYQATWEVPRDAPPGPYEFLVTANRYQLESAPFTVSADTALVLRQIASSPGSARLELDYPAAVGNQDFTYRPPVADAGALTVSVGGRTLSVAVQDGSFTVPAPAGSKISVAPGGAHDAYGNLNGNGVSFTT